MVQQMQSFSNMTGMTTWRLGLASLTGAAGDKVNGRRADGFGRVGVGDAVAAAGNRLAHRPIGPDKVG